MESFIFSPQDRLYFHHALWPFIYFTHFPHKNIFSPKRLHAPTSIPLVAPLELHGGLVLIEFLRAVTWNSVDYISYMKGWCVQ